MISGEMLNLGRKRSCIRELFEYGLKQAALVGKENVYDFSLGNPSIPAPAAVNESIVKILEENDSLSVHGYTPAAGAPKVREAIADSLNRRYHGNIRPQNIFVTAGAASALVSVVRALAVPGAEIIAIAPYFAEYRPFVECQGAAFVPVPADTVNFQIPLAAVEAAVTEHTQGIIVNSPNNPSGVIYSRESLEGLAELLRRKEAEIGHPIYILSDEPYRELVYDGAELPYIPAIYADTVICYSWSKALSLPGERIGYFCVPDAAADSEALFDAAAGAARIMGHVCAPSLQQKIVAACVDEKPDIEAYDRNRTRLYTALSAMGYHCAKPQGAFYLFVQAPGGSAAAFSEAAKKYNLLVVPGDDFGCAEYFRVSTCVDPDMIERSLPAFEKMIAELG